MSPVSPTTINFLLDPPDSTVPSPPTLETTTTPRYVTTLCYNNHNMLQHYQGKRTFPRYSSAIEHEALTAQTQVSPHRKASSF